MPSNATSPSYRFGQAQLWPAERRITMDGRDVGVGGRAFDVLLALIERRDRLVTRDELLDLVWPNVDIEPNNLAVQIGGLRRLLGPQVIATIPGRGYRFSIPVDEAGPTRTVDDAPAAGSRRHAVLPAQPPLLVGREAELRLVGSLVDAHRIVTIVGAGGIGKTRLAQRLLHERRDAFQHGICWVELAAIVDAANLPGAIAAALGIDLRGGDPRAHLESALASLDLLICLDSAEHLAEETGRLVDALIATSERVRILITSQVPLHLADEHALRLGALTVPPVGTNAVEASRHGAIALFVARARAADARFALDDGHVDAVIRLCERLDGLPLAIEFAAARAPVLGVERIVDSLDERLQILKGANPASPARQQTMRATLEWSHQLLGPAERTVFRRLAVVAGSASLELIAATVADADAALDRWAVVDALAGLVDRSLVALVADEGDTDRPRYRLLETTRAYARERLVDAGEVARLEERHAHAVAALLADAWNDRWSGRVGFLDWIETVEADRDNARLAYAWAAQREAFDLVLMMAPVLLTRSWLGTTYDERAAVADAVDRWLAARPAEPAQLAARWQLMRFWGERNLPKALVAAHAARTLAESFDDRFGRYLVEAWLVRLHVEGGDHAAAAASLARTAALEDPAWPPVRLLSGADARSIYCFVGNDNNATLEAVRQQVRLEKLAGFDGLIAGGNLIALEVAVGDFEGATARGYRLLDELATSRNQFAAMHVRINLLDALLAQGDVARATPVAKSAWRTARLFEHHGYCADYLALLCALEGRHPAAATIAGYADAVFARSGLRRWPNEMAAHERTLGILHDVVPQVDVQRLASEGARLADAEVAQVAFEDDGDASPHRHAGTRRSPS